MVAWLLSNSFAISGRLLVVNLREMYMASCRGVTIDCVLSGERICERVTPYFLHTQFFTSSIVIFFLDFSFSMKSFRMIESDASVSGILGSRLA